MSNELSLESHPEEPMVYQIRIKGHLGRAIRQNGLMG